MKSVFIVGPHDREDNIVNLMRGQGFFAVVIPEGRSALGAVRNKVTVDLVITELLLRDMEGVDFIRALKQEEPELPVLVVTRDGSFESYVCAMTAGAFDCLFKPTPPEDLRLCALQAMNLPGPGSSLSAAA